MTIIHRICFIFICMMLTRESNAQKPVCMTEPKDVVFMLDASGSVGQTNFQTMLSSTKTLVSNFVIGPRHIRVAFETFASTVHHEFALNVHSSLKALLKAIGDIQFNSGGTAISTALEYAVNSSFKIGGRMHADKILVLITDGQSYNTNMSAIQGRNLQKMNVKVFCIGVGSYVNQTELELIAKNRNHVLRAKNFTDLVQLMDTLYSKVCRELHQAMTTRRTTRPTTTTTTKTTTTTQATTTPMTTTTTTTSTTSMSTRTLATTTPMTTTTTTTSTTSMSTRTLATTTPMTTTTTTSTTSTMPTTTTAAKTTKTSKTTTSTLTPTTKPTTKATKPIVKFTSTILTEFPTSMSTNAQRETAVYLHNVIHWIDNLEVAILALVCIIFAGFLGCCCRFCFVFFKRREDDSEDQHRRKKPCKRPSEWPS